MMLTMHELISLIISNAALLSSKGESLSDVDQVLIHSEARDYTVEPSTLQSLQQMLQWCADLALKLLATLPDLRHSRAPGVLYIHLCSMSSFYE